VESLSTHQHDGVEEEVSKGANDKYRELRDTAEEYLVRYCGGFYSLVVEWSEDIVSLILRRLSYLEFFFGADESDLGPKLSGGCRCLDAGGRGFWRISSLYGKWV
jgi:hypothetical protein